VLELKGSRPPRGAPVRACVGIVGCLLLGGAVFPADVSVSPFQTIDVRSADSSEPLDIRRVDAIRVAGGRLHVLARLGPEGRHHIVRLSASGQDATAVSLDENAVRNWFDIDTNGDYYVGRTHKPTSSHALQHDLIRVRLDTRNGVAKEVIRTSAFLSGFALRGNDVVYGTADGGLFQAPDAELGRIDAIPMFTHFRFRSDGVLVMVEGATGRVRSVNWQTPNFVQTEFDLETDELNALRARNASRPDAAQALLIGSMSVAEDGHVFLNLASGVRRSQGAVVFELDEAGSTARRWICRLPSRPEDVSAHNPTGAMAPAHIEVGGGVLYIGDYRGLVAKYRLM
jgi:hypothetical protein